MPDTPDSKPLKSPRHAKLLTDEQHKHAADCYLKNRMSPKATADDLNKTFGTSFTAMQISEYARGKTRNWTARRKKNAEAVLEPKTHEITKQFKQDLTKQHAQFIEHSSTLGVKIMKRAETLIDGALDARTLSSAANAAKTGIDIYRKSVGLEDENAPRTQHNVFNMHFARGPGSPFAPGANAVTVIEAEVVAATEGATNG